MSPLPTYPKGFKSDSFVSINSKPKIFQTSSYEALNPIFNMDPPSMNRSKVLRFPLLRVYNFPLLRTGRSLLGREFKLHLTQRCFCVGL